MALTIWKKFDKFDQSSEFMRWVCVIVRFEVLNYRRKMARSRLVFSEDIINLMADEAAEETGRRDAEFSALNSCLENLPDKQRELVNLAYTPGVKTIDLADQLKVNVNNLYMQLSRVGINSTAFLCYLLSGQ